MPAKSPEAVARKRENRRNLERQRRQEARDDLRSQWIAIDGEAVVRADGKHAYVLMCASTGDTLISRDGEPLSTAACVSWLLGLFRDHKGAKFVTYYGDYDLNNWLRDVPWEQIAALWGGAPVDIDLGDFAVKVTYRPGTSVEIGMHAPNNRLSPWGRIEDVRGWMDGGLLKSAAAWGVDIPDEQGARIAHGKKGRGAFQLDELAEIAAYCLDECEVLARIMENVEHAAVTAFGLRPARWHGPGSMAAALMRHYGVPAQMQTETGDIRQAWLAAYYGGRVHAVQIGLVGDVVTYDMRSAFPWAMTQLPTMLGRWERLRPNGHIEQWAVYRVRWDVAGEILAPFPFRAPGGQIWWPAKGEGWYWSPEVAQAKAMYGDRVEILDGFRFIPDHDEKPFAFLHDLFRYRRQVEGVSPQRADVVKRTLTAVYGKCAQGRTLFRKAPPLQSFFWAGLATSLVRAEILKAAALDPAAIVLFQTDAITATRELPLSFGPGLGKWREISRGDAFVLSSGVMQVEGHGIARSKMRGVAHEAASNVDWDVMRYLWKRDGWDMVYTIYLRRFIGMGAAVGLRRPDRWRQWWSMKVRIWTAPNRFDPKPIGEFSWRLMPAAHDEIRLWGVSRGYHAKGDIQSGDEMTSAIERALEREQPLPTIGVQFGTNE